MRLWIMRTGWFNARADAFVPTDQSGERTLAPVYAYLCEAEDGRLRLFDTGCSEALAHNPRAILGPESEALLPQIAGEQDIRAQLAAVGFRPDQVAEVALSHLHFDHAGGNTAFPGAEFWIQRAEWEAAHAPDAMLHYPDPAWRPLGDKLRLLDGDTDWADGLRLVSTPGHTPGHQSLVVRLASGCLVITGDAVYRQSLFDPDRLGAARDPDAARRSVIRLASLVDQGCRAFFSHDPDQWREDWVRLAPDFFR